MMLAVPALADSSKEKSPPPEAKVVVFQQTKSTK
jgi:hypothetical protein